MYGKLVVVGRLGADPEMRYTPNGVAVTQLNLAVDQGWGENKKTLWIRANCWGRKDGAGGLAEVVANILKKGHIVFATGEPSVRAFTSGSGEARASLEMRVDDIKFMTPKAANGDGPASTNRMPPQGDPFMTEGGYQGGGDVDPDSIPF